MNKARMHWSHAQQPDAARWEGGFHTREEAVEAAFKAHSGEGAIYVRSWWIAFGLSEKVTRKPKKEPARRKLRKPDQQKYRKGMFVLQRLHGSGNGDVIAAVVESNPKGSEKVILINSLDPTSRRFLRDPKVLSGRTMVVSKKWHDKVVKEYNRTLNRADARKLAAEITKDLSTREQKKLFSDGN